MPKGGAAMGGAMGGGFGGGGGGQFPWKNQQIPGMNQGPQSGMPGTPAMGGATTPFGSLGPGAMQPPTGIMPQQGMGPYGGLISKLLQNYQTKNPGMSPGMGTAIPPGMGMGNTGFGGANTPGNPEYRPPGGPFAKLFGAGMATGGMKTQVMPKQPFQLQQPTYTTDM